MPVLVSVTGQGTSSPTVAESFSLTFRQSVTFQVQPDLFGLSTTVFFDDASNSLQIANNQPPATLLLTATPPAGATVTFQSQAPFASLALAGPFAGTASTAFELAAADLVQFEAGMMYFSPPVDGGLVNALSYPVFRGADGSTTPFGFNVTLDLLGPLDATRSFFQFADPVLGSTFVTANGKPFALNTVTTGDISTASRLVFSRRPQQSPSEQRYYYLTPAGQFGLALDTGANLAGSGGLSLFAIIGGPQDAHGNNAYVIASNSQSGNTGPGTTAPAPMRRPAATIIRMNSTGVARCCSSTISAAAPSSRISRSLGIPRPR